MFCVAGGCWTGFQLGRRDGIDQLLNFMEANSDENKILKIRFKENDIEFIK